MQELLQILHLFEKKIFCIIMHKTFFVSAPNADTTVATALVHLVAVMSLFLLS